MIAAVIINAIIFVFFCPELWCLGGAHQLFIPINLKCATDFFMSSHKMCILIEPGTGAGFKLVVSCEFYYAVPVWVVASQSGFVRETAVMR